MPRSADIPLEVPVALPAREYAPARARYLTDTGAPRDDAQLPAFLPTGGRVARRITSVDRFAFSGVVDSSGLYRYEVPADDVALNPAELVETTEPPGRRVQPPAPPVVLRRGQAAPPPPPAVFVPDAARVAVIVAPAKAPPAATRIYQNGEAKPRFDWYPKPAVDAHVGLLAVEDPDPAKHGRYLVRRDGAPILAGVDWWKATPSGDTLVVFAPPALRGAFTELRTAEVQELAVPDLVLVRDPHPWIPSALLPPAESFATIGSSYDYARFALERVRAVRSRFMIVPIAKRHAARRRAEGWVGTHEEAPSGNLLGKITDALPGEVAKGLRTAIRSQALQAVLTIAAGVVSFGAGAPIVQAGLAGAKNAGVDVGGFVNAALPAGGPVEPAGGASLGTAGSPVSTGLELAGKAAPQVAQAAPVASPAETNRLLAEAVKGSAYLAGFDSPYGDLLREAVIQAQLSPAKRDELRLKLAIVRSELDAKGGQGLTIARATWKALRSVVVAGATSGLDAAAEAALSVAQRAVSVLTQALEAQNQAELVRIVEAKVRAKQLELVRDLEALLTAQETQPELAPVIETPPPAPAPAPAPASTPAAPAPAAATPPTSLGEALGALGQTFGNLFGRLGSWTSTSTSARS